jgi:secreted protein with Ig-like and vWFA domain
MPAPTMKLAIPSAQQKYLRWAVEAKAGGKTDPEQALLMALSLQPDVVYFLTDGAFKPRVVERVRAANQRLQIAIHTIGFGDDEGEPLLQAIATQNGGTYQFIPDEPTGPDGQTTENVSVETP